MKRFTICLTRCIALLCFAFCTAACSDDDGDSNKKKLQTEPELTLINRADTVHTFSSEGGSYTIRFNTTNNWTLLPEDGNRRAWYVASAEKGASGCNQEVTLSLLPGNDAKQRSLRVALVCGREKVVITLRQSGMAVRPPMSEAEVRACLVRLYNDAGGKDAKLSKYWCSDKPINEWDPAIQYENGKLTLRLAEKNLKGKIDLSGCTALVGLTCDKNQLTSLNLNGCTQLETVSANNSGFTNVDVTGCRALQRLSLDYNELTKIDVTSCMSLTHLFLGNNQLGKLDVSRNVALNTLYCYANLLSELDLHCATTLEELLCYGNALTTLNLDGYTRLSTLNCGWNKLAELSLRRCARIKTLYCLDNSLQELDLTDYAGTLMYLLCSYNNLRALDLKGTGMLSILDCSYNNIPSLDLGQSKRLGQLYANGNRLAALDLSPVPMLTTLEVNNNRLTELDITPCKYLKELACLDNSISAEIPERFDALDRFDHDQRYDYSSGTAVDRTTGWWYPQEPAIGRHSRK